jgi:hypothetical protein
MAWPQKKEYAFTVGCTIPVTLEIGHKGDNKPGFEVEKMPNAFVLGHNFDLLL